MTINGCTILFPEDERRIEEIEKRRIAHMVAEGPSPQEVADAVEFLKAGVPRLEVIHLFQEDGTPPQRALVAVNNAHELLEEEFKGFVSALEGWVCHPGGDGDYCPECSEKYIARLPTEIQKITRADSCPISWEIAKTREGWVQCSDCFRFVDM